MPENLTHGLTVEEVDVTHVAGYPADYLTAHHLVQVAEALVDKCLVEIPAHYPQDILA